MVAICAQTPSRAEVPVWTRVDSLSEGRRRRYWLFMSTYFQRTSCCRWLLKNGLTRHRERHRLRRSLTLTTFQ